MAKTEKRRYVWYVCPLDAHTNRVFSENLPPENSMTVPCADEKIRNLWLCPDRRIAQSFWNSKDDLNLKFEVFNAQIGQTTRDARIRQCTFLFRESNSAKKGQKKPKTIIIGGHAFVFRI